MKKLIFTLISLAAAAVIAAQIQFPQIMEQHQGGSMARYKLQSAENIIENYYVDAVNADSIVEQAIIAMLKTLDPHSLYSTAEETRELDEPLQGNFSGIGITFNNPTDTLIVISTVSGGPAEKVGMKSGDRVLMVNDTVISGVKMPKKDIMKRIRGPKGTQVKVTVERHGEKTPIDFLIIRDDIPIYSVDAAYMVDDKTGYISLSRFAEDTPDEVDKAMRKLRSEGMENIIIDLQDNGGGYLVAATELAEKFLRRGDEILYTQSSRTAPRYYTAESDGDMTKGRVVILVNQNSASASEILSGALQDNDRAVIVGRRTFGKGLVQRPFRFYDGSMMRLTIARYYTPSGRSIQKPYNSGDDKEYRKDILDRYNSGELMNVDSVHFDESQLFHTRAGRPVYGGGGIMPDRFVALDTTWFTPYYRSLLAKSVVVKYTLRYFDENRTQLKRRYPTEQTFIDGFVVTPDMIQQVVDMAKADGVEPDEEQLELSRPYLEAVIKALIGRDLFEQATYYKIMNPINPVFREGYDIISKPQEYERLLMPK